MPWWVWIVLGLALAVLELQVPTNFYLFALGIGAFLVGLLGMMGGGGPVWMQWLLFTGFSVGALVIVQRSFSRGAGKPWAAESGDLVGESAVPTEDIAAGASGRAELRGTVWSARNASDSALARGQRCRVERVEGLTLWIRPE